MCQALPMCLEGEEASDEPCGDEVLGCVEETLCGTTIYCRSDTNCDAAPFCPEGEEGSDDRCAEGEADCYRNTVCGITIYCRGDEN